MNFSTQVAEQAVHWLMEMQQGALNPRQQAAWRLHPVAAMAGQIDTLSSNQPAARKPKRRRGEGLLCSSSPWWRSVAKHSAVNPA